MEDHVNARLNYLVDGLDDDALDDDELTEVKLWLLERAGDLKLVDWEETNPGCYTPRFKLADDMKGRNRWKSN